MWDFNGPLFILSFCLILLTARYGVASRLLDEHNTVAGKCDQDFSLTVPSSF